MRLAEDVTDGLPNTFLVFEAARRCPGPSRKTWPFVEGQGKSIAEARRPVRGRLPRRLRRWLGPFLIGHRTIDLERAYYHPQRRRGDSVQQNPLNPWRRGRVTPNKSTTATPTARPAQKSDEDCLKCKISDPRLGLRWFIRPKKHLRAVGRPTSDASTPASREIRERPAAAGGQRAIRAQRSILTITRSTGVSGFG